MITDLKQTQVSSYNKSLTKRIFDLGLFVIIFIPLFPLLFITSVLIRIFFCPSIFFIQKRVGKNGKIFKILKFRTMIKEAENERLRYIYLNETDGPVFKIRNDPRFTKIGKLLSRTGLDELPQFINVLKGEMSLVGPRPLPTYEFNKLTEKQKIRNLVKPGITSLWVINGSHNLSFNEWMRLDKRYVEEANLLMDINIIFKTILIPIKTLINIVFYN